jgi:hypothetical protein
MRESVISDGGATLSGGIETYDVGGSFCGLLESVNDDVRAVRGRGSGSSGGWRRSLPVSVGLGIEG